MDTLVESGSPRRGSLSSLHRQSAGSSHYSHNSKLASPGSNNSIPGNTNCINPSPNVVNPNLYKDLDKFTRYFVIKTVQVIVQSRISTPPSPNISGDIKPPSSPTLSASPGVVIASANSPNSGPSLNTGSGTSSNNSSIRRVRTECKPLGNDWFNLNIPDIAEVRETTKAAIEPNGPGSLSVKSNWRVCCEISLKTNDGSTVVLEHWIVSNRSITNHPPSTSLLSSTTKLSPSNQQNQSTSSSPKSPQNNRNSSPTQIATSNNNPLSAINTSPQLQQSPTRTRTSTFGNTMRTRLNSIEDCSGDNSYSVNRLLVDTGNENYDTKASKSCYSLSNSPAISNPVGIENSNTVVNVLPPSPSTNSLPTSNLTQSSTIANANPTTTTLHNSTTPTNTTNSQPGFKSSAVSSIYTIYNRMSLLLKTLMTTTHIVPAYRLASRTSATDPCVIYYRVYACPTASYQNTRANKGSIEDVNYNPSLDSPNKRSSSSSNSSFDSLNIRDFVAVEELDHFCPILKLGTIKTDINELDLSVCYRTDVRNSSQLLRNPRSRGIYEGSVDEDCIIAAKQLLAGNEYNRLQQNKRNEELRKEKESPLRDPLSYLDEPLRPPFAFSEPKFDPNDPNLQIMDSVFEKLLEIKRFDDDEQSTYDKIKDGLKDKNGSSQPNIQSDPIQVPRTAHRRDKPLERPRGSTPKSLLESFVFVDINPPFASEEHGDLASFFHGPSPVFSNGFDSLKDIDEVTSQLADLEANASQLDEFVDNICMEEGDGDEDNQDNRREN